MTMLCALIVFQLLLARSKVKYALFSSDVYKHVSITLLEAAHTVLGSFDKSVRN